jgi:filamentous hemagglutinin
LNANQGGTLAAYGAAYGITGNFLNNNASTLYAGLGGSLTVNGNLTNSNGSVVQADGSTITVTGNLINDVSSTVKTSSGNGKLTVSGSLTNAGALSLLTSSNAVNLGSLTSTGTVSVAAGATLTTTGGASISGGILEGAGTVNGAVTVASGAVVLPGSNTTTPGTLTFGNGVTLGGTLEEVVNGGSAGQFGLINTGALTLNASSTLQILQAGGYNPAAGTTLTIATASAPISGTFGSILNASFNGGSEIWHVLYNQGGDNIELEAFNVAPTPVTATASGSFGNWTKSSLWSCAPGPSTCIPNNGGPQNYAYTAIVPLTLLVSAP